MTGSSGYRRCASCRTTHPSNSGNLRSSSIKSGRLSRSFVRASVPVAAVSTHSPSWWKTSRSNERIPRWSSTTRSVCTLPPPCCSLYSNVSASLYVVSSIQTVFLLLKSQNSYTRLLSPLLPAKSVTNRRKVRRPCNCPKPSGLKLPSVSACPTTTN